jgi:hypothetical protein
MQASYADEGAADRRIEKDPEGLTDEALAVALLPAEHAEGEARIRSPNRVLLPTARLFLRVQSLIRENGARS